MPLSGQLKKLAEMSSSQVYQNIPIHPNEKRGGVSYNDVMFKRMHIGVQNSQSNSMGGKRRVNSILENSRTGFG